MQKRGRVGSQRERPSPSRFCIPRVRIGRGALRKGGKKTRAIERSAREVTLIIEPQQ